MYFWGRTYPLTHSQLRLHLSVSIRNFDGIWRAVITKKFESACPFFWHCGIALAVGLLVGPLVLPAMDWPTYQHDYQRSGITMESLELPMQESWTYIPSKPPSPAWPDPAERNYYLSPSSQKPLPPRLAFDRAYYVVAVGQSVFFGSSTEHTVNCLQANTGREKWSFFTDGPVRMAPSVYEGRVYAGSDDGAVYCLDAANGALVWKCLPAGAENYLAPNDGMLVSPWAVRTSVAVEDGVAYFAAGFFPHAGVYICAVDAATGQQTNARHWKRKFVNQMAMQGYLLLSPSRVYVPGSRSNPFFFSRSLGTSLGRMRGAMGTYALLAENNLIFGPADRNGALLTEVNEAGDQIAQYADGNCMVVSKSLSYLLSDNSLQAIRRSDKAQIWGQAVAYPYALILAGDTLFAGGNGEVAAFENATGKRLWTGQVQGKAYGLAVAEGRLYVSTDTGAIHCFQSDQSKLQSLWMLY
jgi:outer membrane protein assembly factor BamB